MVKLEDLYQLEGYYFVAESNDPNAKVLCLNEKEAKMWVQIMNDEKDLQVRAYNQAAKEHMISSISFALDFIEANSFPTDEIDAMQEGLRNALNLIKDLEL
jgi:hypothetical protein